MSSLRHVVRDMIDELQRHTALGIALMSEPYREAEEPDFVCFPSVAGADAVAGRLELA